MTIEQIAYRIALKSQSDIILRAAEIEAGMWDTKPETIAVNLSPEQRGEKDPNVKAYAVVDCPVLAVDPENLNAPYLIRYPSGQSRWVADCNARR